MLTIEEISELEKEFYSKKLQLSYSGLSKFFYSPRLFYNQYVLKQKEEQLDGHLIDGKIIHCLLLDDGSFDKQFLLGSSNLPTENTKLVVDRVYTQASIQKDFSQDLWDHKDIILEVLKDIKLHQSLKTDAQRLEKIITEASKNYFAFLAIKGSRDIIDQETLSRCNEAVTAVKNDSTACFLMGLFRDELENIDVFNETTMSLDKLGDHKFGIRGILDNIKVDYDTKKVYINDLKTSTKSLTDFPETVEYFNYWAQACIYENLVKENFKELLTEEWEVLFHFIVVDKFNQVYCFKVSTATMKGWQDKLEGKLREFDWHYTERKFKLPYVYAIGEVTL